MSWIKYILLLIGLGVMTACQTTQIANSSDTAARTDQLPAQVLHDGECGLFGFSKSDAKLLFFSSQIRGLYWLNGATRSLSPQGVFPDLDFENYTLDLGVAEPLEDGRRYPDARLSHTMDDGFRRIQPLVILETCGRPDTDLG